MFMLTRTTAVEIAAVHTAWRKAIQIIFVFDEDQVVDHSPLPIMDIPRQTYFGLEIEKLRVQYQHLIKEEIKKLKLPIIVEYKGLPMHMEYPVGVSHDLFAYDREDVTIPWCLTLRFQEYPPYQYISSSAKTIIRTYFSSSIKEAVKIKKKDRTFRHLSFDEKENLWQGLVDHDFKTFWTVNMKLMDCKNHTFKLIPFYIYQLDKCVLKGAVSPIFAIKENLSLMDLINQFAPEVAGVIDKYHVFILGFDVPVTTLAIWLSTNYSCPDNYLHIVIVPKVVRKSEDIKHDT